MRHRTLPSILCATLLGACATTSPFDLGGVDRGLTPAQALAEPAARGRAVQWGGLILDARNLKDGTQLEVLAFPLLDNGRPARAAAPLGRFVLIQKGYLETLDFAPGRWLTVVGPVGGVLEGRLGEVAATYPVVSPEQRGLWPQDAPFAEPQLHFGIGMFYSR